MQISSRFTIAVHIFACIDTFEKDHKITSDFLADSINVNPVIIRKLLSQLKNAGLIQVKRGSGGASFARPLEDITLLDIYRAVEGNKPLLHPDTHTNPGCDVGVDIQLAVRDCFDQVQETAEQEMQNITLQQILDQYEKRHEQK